ncbi:MAG: glycerol-3-phosphate acyltransferase, partial [Planctomycetota bacterium]
VNATLLAGQWVLVAVAAVCGHVFSPWLKFRGGKGVATGLGAALGLFPVVTVPAVVAFVIWFAVCKITGYVGLASSIAAASLPVLTVGGGLVFGLGGGEIAVFAALTGVLAALVILRHRGNLARIRAGTEPKAAWTGHPRKLPPRK